MARRLGDRLALGYALRDRMHVLWGIDPAPERLAAATELGEIADDVGDQFLALHGHMWRIRELLAQGDVDAVNEELTRFQARDTGPVHPLEASWLLNVGAMMALLAGDIEQAESMARRGLEVAEGYNELVVSFYGALMVWTWWQRDELVGLETMFQDVIGQALDGYPIIQAVLALIHAEAGRAGQGDGRSGGARDEIGWDLVAKDQTEGLSLALAAAACGGLGARARDHALARVRADAPVCRHCDRDQGAGGRRASARPTTTSGCWPRPPGTSPWPRCTSMRRCGWRHRMGCATLRSGGRGRAGADVAPAGTRG